MRTGWDLKSAAWVLGIHEKKVSQAIDPAFAKVAKLMLADPLKTMTALQDVMQQIRGRTLRPVALGR